MSKIFQSKLREHYQMHVFLLCFPMQLFCIDVRLHRLHGEFALMSVGTVESGSEKTGERPNHKVISV